MNISFIIDGAATKAEGGATFERKDPMTGKGRDAGGGGGLGRR
jgi:hypothetical protein